MNIRYQSKDVSKIVSDILALFLYDQKDLSRELNRYDKKTGRVLSHALTLKDFSGKLGSTLLLIPKSGSKVKRVLLVGLGKQKDFSLDTMRQAISSAVMAVKATPARQAVFCLTDTPVDNAEAFGQMVTETIRLSLYEFGQYREKSKDERPALKDTTILVDQNHLKDFQRGNRYGESIARAVNLCRDLANEPANIATPTLLAQHAKDVAKRHKLGCQILEIADMKRLKMGALLGVAQGSDEPAKFIILEYGKKTKTQPTIVLAGKGITFDSGGISIKPSDRMDEMKFDMAGGATVIATLQAAADLQLPVHVVGLVPSTENLPSGKAQRPGDIVRAMNGKTIEVLNTDAEGRMILADALSYAGRYKPDAVIDVATLTGAIVLALGEHASGLFSNNAKLQDALEEAGHRTGERLWPMPMYKEYAEQIKGDIADLKNIGGRDAGPITAAKFLEQFTDYSWAHLDVAGTAWTTKPKPYTPKGATGVGVRLLIDLLRNWK